MPRVEVPNDYWSIEDILSEEGEVVCRSNFDIAGAGILRSDQAARQSTLKVDTKVQIPFWLAQGFVRRQAMDLELPSNWGKATEEDLIRDPITLRLADMSPYYFEVGFKVAALLKQKELKINLFKGFVERWKEMVSLLSKSFSTSEYLYSSLNPECIFPQTLTVKEQELFNGTKEADRHVKEWTESYARKQIPVFADVPSKRPRWS
mmetsp:Transcript_34152/g.77953  ORF Transcript_34152/g.77953 Transcript_34152/m.77953 type:complete len:206 (+) Transcript_34152:32-649(+)